MYEPQVVEPDRVGVQVGIRLGQLLGKLLAHAGDAGAEADDLGVCMFGDGLGDDAVGWSAAP